MMKVENKIVLTEMIIGMDDHLYHRDTMQISVAESVEKQARSLERYNLPLYVLTNTDQQTTQSNVHMLQIELPKYQIPLSFYFLRWRMAFDFLQAHSEIKWVALTDATDVELLNYPFDQLEENRIYFGDEPTYISGSDLIIQNKNPTVIQGWLWANGHLIVLNPGVILGSRMIILEYLGAMIQLINEEELKAVDDSSVAGMGNLDMAVVNYVAYRYFNRRLVHGRRVSTVFHEQQQNRGSWFKHK